MKICKEKTIYDIVHIIKVRYINRSIDKVVKSFINLYYPLKFKILNNKIMKKKEKEKENQKVIVSLTAIPSRIDRLHLVIKSILLQSMRPDKIILCLIRGEFPEEYVLPKSLIELLSSDFEINWCEENLMPHNKYYYTMKKYPDSIIITIDDDGFYRKNLIRDLIRSYERYPEAISCARAHKIKFTDNGEILPYKKWEYETTMSNKPSHYLMATGVGGVLYPPNAFDKRAFNSNQIKKLSLKADDVWLKAMEILCDKKVVLMPVKYKYVIGINHAETINLMNENVQGSRNDKYIAETFKEYRIKKEQFEK